MENRTLIPLAAFPELIPRHCPPPKVAPAPPASAAVMTIPAGTRIAVRMIDSIDGKTARAGMRYRASIDDPVAVGSQVAIPKLTNCTVEVVTVQSGDEMALRLREVNLGGKAYSTSTDDAAVEATGTSKGKKPPGGESDWGPWGPALEPLPVAEKGQQLEPS